MLRGDFFSDDTFTLALERFKNPSSEAKLGRLSPHFATTISLENTGQFSMRAQNSPTQHVNNITSVQDTKTVPTRPNRTQQGLRGIIEVMERSPTTPTLDGLDSRAAHSCIFR
ncbi:hypothetical protein Sjap_007095 [Stephania japonica]|uniref:Uncharacterized protein n=1 Tax=Stephania japonica TaxID=461633 RepID=A0AAP0JMY0_9MAGN